jgi:hypothetical protein
MDRSRTLGTLYRNTCVLGEHVGWMEGPVGVRGPPFPAQNNTRIRPMRVQPTTAFTLSISHSFRGRIENP